MTAVSTDRLVQQILELAQGLSERDRLALAVKLVGSLSDEQRAANEQAWDEEIRRRLAQFERGDAGVSLEDLRTDIGRTIARVQSRRPQAG